MKKCNILTESKRFITHYVLLFILGILSWGIVLLIFGEEWHWNGRWFRVAAVAAAAWSSGQILQSTTTLPPLMAALLTGIVARNVGYLDMRYYTHLDGFLRKIYPVVILGKASLGWDVHFMRKNWRIVAALGAIPWLAEVVTLVVCMHLLLDFPWIWGFLLGSFYASVSCAVVMPTVNQLSTNKEYLKKLPHLVCTAGGVDTALSVGVFSVIYNIIFYQGNDNIYQYLKAIFALLLGVALGFAWGSLAKFLPDSHDSYKTELRILFVLIGGFFAIFLTSHFEMGGIAGMAVLTCNATAATHWVHDEWKLNNNPASTAYRVFWSALEPALFAYTGTFFVIASITPMMMLIGSGILFICLTVRLVVTYLICWNMNVTEKLFFCCTWIPKSIVEAVLTPVALNTVLSRDQLDEAQLKYSNEMIQLVVQAILITTPVGYLLTKYLGPILLEEKSKTHENGEM